MPDFDKLTRVPDSEYEELFDNTTKLASSSPFTKEFDIKGAVALILHQSATMVGTTARTIESNTNWANPTIITDDDLNNSTSTTVSGEIIVDFGSIATREITSKGRAVIQATGGAPVGASASVSISYSEDDVSYSGGGTVVQSNGIESQTVDNTATRVDPGVSMRYAKLTATANPGANSYNPTCYGFEVFEGGTGLGTGTISFEILNELTGLWETLDIGFSSLPVQDSSVGSNDTVQSGDISTRNFPKGPGKIRAKYVITDGCDATAGIVKIFG